MRYTESYVEGLRRRAASTDLSALKGKTVLVTGATGLVGSALADVLLCANETLGLGMRVVLAGRDEGGMRGRFSHWGEGTYRFALLDLLKPVDFGFRSDYIVHCAGIAHPAAIVKSPVEVIVGNVGGTSGILEHARSCGATRVLYVSSSEVYGRRGGDGLWKEADQAYVDPQNPRSCYPSSKRDCETLCAAYLSEYGVDTVVARPGHVWGPTATESDSRAHAQFAREAAAGRDIVMKSPGSQLRSYIHGTDCAGALLTILLRGVVGEAYNVGVPGFTCTIRQLAGALAEAGGVGIVRDYPSEQEEAGYNMMSCSALDCSKLATLGFGGQLTLEEAARQTVECMGGKSL